MTRILLFGGSFDPLHHGHLIIGRHVAEALGVPRVVLMPSGQPPHKPGRTVASVAERVAMCELVAAENPLFAVDPWEAEQSGPSYTLNTIRHVRDIYGPEVQLLWLVGLDSLNELHTWYRAQELVAACQIVTALRPGTAPPDERALTGHFGSAAAAQLLRHVVPGLQIDISSTQIRARLAAGRDIRYLVPPAVGAYIQARGLYRRA